jgi:chromosome partitioning protein
LRKAFGVKTLPPVRVNTKLAEAPRVRKTIFEYASDSHGAADYNQVVEWLRQVMEHKNYQHEILPQVG